MNWKRIRQISMTMMPIMYLGFVLLSSVGIVHMGMHMGADGHMHDCPFMNFLAVCDMTPLQHLSAWRDIFGVLSTKELALLALATLLYFLTTRALACAATLKPVPYRPRVYIFVMHVPLPVSELMEALSNGIIHSKAY